MKLILKSFQEYTGCPEQKIVIFLHSGYFSRFCNQEKKWVIEKICI